MKAKKARYSMVKGQQTKEQALQKLAKKQLKKRRKKMKLAKATTVTRYSNEPKNRFSISEMFNRGIEQMNKYAGKPRRFENPQALLLAAKEYFDYIETHPLMKAEIVKNKWGHTLEEVPLMHVATWNGFLVFCGLSGSYFNQMRYNEEYPQREEYLQVLETIAQSIKQQKFAGAAVGLLNANLIARDLGLRDLNEQPTENGGGELKAPIINIIQGSAPGFVINEPLKLTKNGNSNSEDTE